MKNTIATLALGLTLAFSSLQFASASESTPEDSGPCPELTGTYLCGEDKDELEIAAQQTDGKITSYSIMQKVTAGLSSVERPIFYKTDGEKTMFTFFDPEEEEEVEVSSYCSDSKLQLDVLYTEWDEMLSFSYAKAPDYGPDYIIVTLRLLEEGEEFSKRSLACRKQ